DDKVPTLIRNPKWVSLIEPVFKFIDIAPGYREYDISLFFLLFFSLFVGMLIGDAGYGMLFIAAVAWVHFKSGKKMQDPVPLYLAYVLSGCVVAWGVLTGTFFGQQWLAQTSLQPVLPWLKENANIQLFCFTLGAIHLSVAHIWRTIQKFPSVSFLSDVGWLALLWGMFAMSRTLILGAALSPAAVNLLIGGAVLVVFFTRPNWNPLKAVGPGLGDLALNVVNTFTDVVSYIRLFAVGLATVAVADATNSMAAEVGGVWSLLILLVGHGINIVLALMAILVHGLRLNVLEFSGHLNMEWAGFNYVPFKKAKNA
ncbi:MAG: V-type ATP synthase subunit I, partial [Candidatus Omnitrophica bacterium]|nr:V-type ATP synthase subunit I [Candidatus Omnitrophota bacterium]